MPLFEYRCQKCGNVFEELVTGDRDRNIPCSSCGNEKTEKLMSAIGGISMGKTGDLNCGGACSHASSCASSGGGCCPHAA